jgi:hypothetical protein
MLEYSPIYVDKWYLLYSLLVIKRIFIEVSSGTQTCPIYRVNQQHKLYVYVKISEYQVASLNEIKSDKT